MNDCCAEQRRKPIACLKGQTKKVNDFLLIANNQVNGLNFISFCLKAPV